MSNGHLRPVIALDYLVKDAWSLDGVFASVLPLHTEGR